MIPSLEIYRCPSTPLPDRKALIDACENEYKAQRGNTNHINWPVTGEPQFFVKFGVNTDLTEAQNQMYFFKETQQSQTIRVPEVFWAFWIRDTWMTYIVMEFIKSRGFASGQQRAVALAELLKVRVPSDAAPGPIGGGLLHHILFKHYKASRVYATVEKLEWHINKVSSFMHSFLPKY